MQLETGSPAKQAIQPNTITCDQVAWLKQAIDEHSAALLSKKNMQDLEWRSALDVGLLIRIMTIVNVRFRDAEAAWNAISSIQGTHLIWQSWKGKD